MICSIRAPARVRAPKRLIVGFLLFGGVSVCAAGPTHSGESERDVLARVVHELRAIDALVAEADERKATGARLSFDYQQLRLELNAVSRGIEEYIGGTRMQPRSFEALSADYTHVKTHAAEGEE